MFGFLLIILIIAATHIAIYAKYKNGAYTIYNVEDHRTRVPMDSFPRVRFISVRDLPYAQARFGDIAQVEKGIENQVLYVRNGDTLIITGKNQHDQRISGDRISLTIPYSATVSFFNSSVILKPGKENSEINTELRLQRSSALFTKSDKLLQFGNMKIIASDSSIATFEGNTHVGNFEVQLLRSAFEYDNGNFDQLSITNDSVSRISLQTKNLLKARITTVPGQ